MFNSESAKKAGKKSKRGPAKKKRLDINQKAEELYHLLLDNLMANFEKLSLEDRIKLFVLLSNKLSPKSTNNPKIKKNKDLEEFSLAKLAEKIRFTGPNE